MSPAVRRLGTILIAALYAVSTWSIPLASPVLAQTTETFLDEFRSVSFGGNDGSSSFTGPWRERGEADGPTAGSIQVAADDRCSGGSGNCLRVGSDGGDLAPYAVDRSADLGGAENATMRFSWRRRSQGQVSGAVRVLISGNGGSSWTTLTTIPLAGSQQVTSETFDITPWAGSATTLRFDGEGSGVSGYLHLDNVEVEASIVPPATTTTTPPGSTTTTTMGAGTTSTTPPGTSTTTTTMGAGTPTTTPPGSTTTTTLGTGAPTTRPQGTSTTSATESTDGATTPAGAAGADTPDGDQGLAPPRGDGPARPPAAGDTTPSSGASALDSTSPSRPGEGGASDEPLAVDSGSVDSSSAATPPISLVIAQILVLGSLIALLGVLGVGRVADGVKRS